MKTTVIQLSRSRSWTDYEQSCSHLPLMRPQQTKVNPDRIRSRASFRLGSFFQKMYFQGTLLISIILHLKRATVVYFFCRLSNGVTLRICHRMYLNIEIVQTHFSEANAKSCFCVHESGKSEQSRSIWTVDPTPDSKCTCVCSLCVERVLLRETVSVYRDLTNDTWELFLPNALSANMKVSYSLPASKSVIVTSFGLKCKKWHLSWLFPTWF